MHHDIHDYETLFESAKRHRIEVSDFGEEVNEFVQWLLEQIKMRDNEISNLIEDRDSV